MKQALFEAGQQKVQNAPQLYVDLDVESDGIPGYGSLLSIGAITPWGEEFYRELLPTSAVWLPGNRDFCEAHGLQRTQLLQYGTNPPEAITDLAAWTLEQQVRHQKTGSVLVAFNASYDFPWVDLEMKKAGVNNPFGVAGYCVKSLANQISPDYDWSKTSKSKLPAEVVPEGDFTHNALEDAIWQQQLHFALIGFLDAKV